MALIQSKPTSAGRRILLSILLVLVQVSLLPGRVRLQCMVRSGSAACCCVASPAPDAVAKERPSCCHAPALAAVENPACTPEPSCWTRPGLSRSGWI